jgi:hypothetical protein
MLLPAPREDLVRATRTLLSLEGVQRSAIDLALDLRARGWTVDAGHLEDVMTRADTMFLRVGDEFVLLPEAGEPPATLAITREQVHDRLTRKLSASWWRVIALRAAYPPLPQAPLSPLARRLDEDRRTRTFRVAKVHSRHAWLVAWVDQVTLVRRENLPDWACWEVCDLDRWEPGRDPVQPRYRSVPADQLVLVHPAPDAAAMAHVLLDVLTATGARPEDVWIEPVPADGAEVDARERALAQARTTSVARPGRHAALPACRSCGGRLDNLEDTARGEHAPCWARHEPAHCEVVRHTRREWVGALDLPAWARAVAEPPRGGAPGLSRGRVGTAPIAG